MSKPRLVSRPLLVLAGFVALITLYSVQVTRFQEPLPRLEKNGKSYYIGRLDRFLVRRFGQEEGEKIYAFLAGNKALKERYDRSRSFIFSAHRALFERPEYLDHPELLRSPALLQYPDLALDPIRLMVAHRQWKEAPGEPLPKPSASRYEMNWSCLHALSFYDALRSKVEEQEARRLYAYVSEELPEFFADLTSEKQWLRYRDAFRDVGIIDSPSLLKCPALREDFRVVLDPEKFTLRCRASE